MIFLESRDCMSWLCFIQGIRGIDDYGCYVEGNNYNPILIVEDTFFYLEVLIGKEIVRFLSDRK